MEETELNLAEWHLVLVGDLGLVVRIAKDAPEPVAGSPLHFEEAYFAQIPPLLQPHPNGVATVAIGMLGLIASLNHCAGTVVPSLVIPLGQALPADQKRYKDMIASVQGQVKRSAKLSAESRGLHIVGAD